MASANRFAPLKTVTKIGAAAAAAAVMLTAVNANAVSNLSEDECKAIIVTASSTIKDIGASNLSSEFVDSFRAFIAPNGKANCSGSRDIATPLGKDIDAYNIIKGALYNLKTPHSIDLDKSGFRAVPSISVAALN